VRRRSGDLLHRIDPAHTCAYLITRHLLDGLGEKVDELPLPIDPDLPQRHRSAEPDAPERYLSSDDLMIGPRSVALTLSSLKDRPPERQS